MGCDLNILVLGCGSIGERHIANLKTIYNNISICGFDTNLERLKLIEKKYGIQTLSNFEEIYKTHIDAAIICTPPNLHVEMALQFVENDIHIFVEKPLSNRIHNVDKLIKNVNSKGLIAGIGYNFRFHEGIKFIKKMVDNGELQNIMSMQAFFGDYLPHWRPYQDYNENYITHTESGGGIILDGSHEIDYMQWILGEAKEVFCYSGNVSSLKMETEDIAEILIKFKNDRIGQIHLDCLRPEYLRRSEIVSENRILNWNYIDKSIDIYSTKENKHRIIKTNHDNNHMYVNEIKNFIESILGTENIVTPLEEGKKTLNIALKAKKSAEINEALKI